MFHGPGINYETLRDSPRRTKMGTRILYAQSKYGNVAIARELARLYGDQGIVSTVVNPGNLKTELQRHSSAAKFNVRLFFYLYTEAIS